MKLFTVDVVMQVRDVVVVDAEDDEEAHDLAVDAVIQRLARYQPYLPTDGLPGDPIETTVQEDAPAGARPATYVCHHCNKPSPKELWGPGWMTCPNCGKRWLSVSEVAELMFEVVNAFDPKVPDELTSVEETLARFEQMGYTVGVAAARRALARRLTSPG